MAVVIDANTSSRIFRDKSQYPRLIKWLFVHKDGKLGIGGYLETELLRLINVRRRIAVLDRAGRLKRVNDTLIQNEYDSGTWIRRQMGGLIPRRVILN